MSITTDEYATVLVLLNDASEGLTQDEVVEMTGWPRHKVNECLSDLNFRRSITVNRNARRKGKKAVAYGIRKD